MTPPQQVVDYLKTQPHLFSQVHGIPGIFPSRQISYSYHNNQNIDPVAEQRKHAQADLSRLMQMARGLGSTHLFLFGGTVDYGSRENAMSVFDLTIIGAFLMPGRSVEGLGKGSGALIDLSSERIVFVTTSQAQKKGLSSTVGREGAEQRILNGIREQVIRGLVENFVADAARMANLPVNTAPSAAQGAAPGWPNQR